MKVRHYLLENFMDDRSWQLTELDLLAKIFIPNPLLLAILTPLKIYLSTDLK
jgi:hypothetical protein